MNGAIQITEYGSPEVLRWVEGEIPTPGAGEIVLRTIASGVNRADLEIRSGKWPVQKSNPFPYTPGLEVAGEVVALGPGVKGWKVGQSGITMMQKLGGIHGIRPGGYQSHVCVPARTLAVVPEGADVKELAALGLAAVTALQGVSRMPLKVGNRVLVQGATGGVGGAALQLLVWKGLRPVALTRDPKKADQLRALGAAEVLGPDEVPEPVDGVLEMLSGEAFGRSVSWLRPGGTLVSVGGILGDEARFTIWDLLEGRHLTGWSSENLTLSELQSSVDVLLGGLKSGVLDPPPIEEFSLNQADRAHALMESGDYLGRILLVPG